MTAYKIRISEKADRDMNNILSYIAFDLGEPETAMKNLAIIKETIFSLALMPQRHSVLNEKDFGQIRLVMARNWLIFYMIADEEKTVYVVRVLNSRTGWKGLLKI